MGGGWWVWGEVGVVDGAVVGCIGMAFGSIVR